MKKVASWAVGAVPGHPVFLAMLGLVLGIAHHLPQLSAPVSKLALVAVHAPGLFLEVATHFSLVTRI